MVIAAASATARAEQPPSPCHPNPLAAQDEATVRNRGDIVNLPMPLKDRLARLANRPHSQLPTQAYAEADKSSQLFQYYLLDTNGFQPNVFTKIFPGINDHAQLSVTGGNCGLPTIGAVRLVLEPKPGLPTDPHDPRAFIDVFTDISGLFVIDNESGWYEGWIIRQSNCAGGQSDAAARRPCAVRHDSACRRGRVERNGLRPQRSGRDLYDRWFAGTFPECIGRVSENANQRSAHLP